VLPPLHEFMHHVRGDPEQIRERLAHQFGIADPQQPGEDLLGEIVGIVGVAHASHQKPLQLD